MMFTMWPMAEDHPVFLKTNVVIQLVTLEAFNEGFIIILHFIICFCLMTHQARIRCDDMSSHLDILFILVILAFTAQALILSTRLFLKKQKSK